jgi:hypothetical protein
MANLATVQPVALPTTKAVNPFEPSSIQEALTLSNMLSKSALVPAALRGKPADIFIILATARELGIGPMQGLSDINVIQGKPVYSADLMVAKCKRHPEVCRYFRLVKSTSTEATYETHRVGSPEPERATFTMEDANRLGLAGKDSYQRQPATMLRRRAAAALARETYQDLVRGYDPDEAELIGVPLAQIAEVQVSPPADEEKSKQTQTDALKEKLRRRARVEALLAKAKRLGFTKEGLDEGVAKALGALKRNGDWSFDDMDKIEAELDAPSEKRTLDPGFDPDSMEVRGEHP